VSLHPWIRPGSDDDLSARAGVALNAYQIANLVPIIFDANDTGDWRMEVLTALGQGAEQIGCLITKSNDGRTFTWVTATRRWEDCGR